MELIVVSDSHGMTEQLENVVRNYPKANYYIHCGDSELPNHMLSNFCAVEGNNDFYKEYPDHIILDLNDDYKALVIHGHRQGVYSGLNNLAALAKKYGCNMAFYGHTHVFRYDIVDGVTVLNPGCLLYNRDFTPGSFARVVIEGKDIKVTRITTSSLEK